MTGLAYDADGNMTSRRENGVTWTQTFDFENRLTSASNGTQTWQFVYDGDGNRVKQIAADGTVTVYVGGIYEATYTGTTLTRTRLYYALGSQVVAMRENGTLYYLHSDNLGSASLTTSASGSVVSQSRYYPFGALRFAQGARPTDIDFTGQILDGTGLHFYVARYYSSGLGRFLQPDIVIPNPGGSQAYNRYAYASNSPVSRVDPTGHDDEPWWKRSLCETVPILCQPSPNFVPAEFGVLTVQESEQLWSGAETSHNASKSKGSARDKLLVTLAKFFPPAAKLAQEGYNKLCADDGDCTDEVRDTVNTLKSAEGIGPFQNLGAAYWEIEGEIGEKVVGSAIRAQDGIPWQRIFTYINPQAQAHSESMLLEFIGQRFFNNPQAQGVIRLFTYREPCGTCASVIQQFNEMFPNIQLYIYYLEKTGG